jgi:hypothetical protein
VTDLVCRCGTTLERPETGRPPRYCSTTCRRSAEYELRRWQQLLLRAQKASQDARLRYVLHPSPVNERSIEFWEHEVEGLAELLDDALVDSGEGEGS